MIQILAETAWSMAQSLFTSGAIDLDTLEKIMDFSCSVLCLIGVRP